MKETEYLIDIEPTGRNRVRVRFSSEKGKIFGFVVQFEILTKERWHPVIRYDTAHKEAHVHTLHPDESSDRRVLEFSSYNEAYTYATQDIKARWSWYRLRYEEELENYDPR